MIQFILDNKPFSQTDREDLIPYYLGLGCEEIDVLYNGNFINPIWNGTDFIEGATPEEIAEQALSKIALHEKYPEVIGMNWQLLQLDNLPSIQRMEPISDKGLKGIKKYQKDGVLIWSIETKFWFELDSTFPEGVIKTVKIYDLGERVIDWKKRSN